MSINPNPDSSSLARLEKASDFIVFGICAAVLVTAGSVILDLYVNGVPITPSKFLMH